MKLLLILAVLFVACARADPSLTTAQMAMSGAALNTLPYSDLDQIAGLDFLGCGYDLKYDQGKLAITLPLVNYKFTSGATFEYPTNRFHLYSVPDQVWARVVGEADIESYTYTSTDEYLNKIFVDLGITFGMVSNSSGSCTNSSTPSGVPSNACASANATNSSSTKALSLGLEVNYLNQQFSTNDIYIVEQYERTSLFQIYLDQRNLAANYRPAFSTSLQNLTGQLVSENAVPFLDFVETYGTHYVFTATLGGMVRLRSQVNQQMTTDTQNFDINLSGGYGISEGDAQSATNANFALGLSGNIDFQTSQLNKRASAETSSTWQLVGGDTRVVDLLTSANSSTQIVNWKLTLTKNPVPVRYKLKPIQDLVTDDLLASQIALAAQVYLTNTNTDAITNIAVALEKRSPTIDIVRRDGSVSSHFVGYDMVDKYQEAMRRRR